MMKRKNRRKPFVYFVKCGDEILSRGTVYKEGVKPEDITLEFHEDYREAKELFVANRRKRARKKHAPQEQDVERLQLDNFNSEVTE